MCNPMLVSVAMAAFSARQQSQQASYQAGVNDYNARVAENEAEDVRSIGVEEENRVRLRTAQLIGKQEAQIGAAGVRSDVGSPAQLISDTQLIGEADALRVRGSFTRQAEALETGGALLSSSAGASRQAAGNLGAASTILTAGAGAAAINSQWYSPDSSALQTAATP